MLHIRAAQEKAQPWAWGLSTVKVDLVVSDNWGCPLISLPIAGKQVLPWREIWVVHLCVYHRYPRWLSLFGYHDSDAQRYRAGRGRISEVVVPPQLQRRKNDSFQRGNEILLLGRRWNGYWAYKNRIFILYHFLISLSLSNWRKVEFLPYHFT